MPSTLPGGRSRKTAAAALGRPPCNFVALPPTPPRTQVEIVRFPGAATCWTSPARCRGPRQGTGTSSSFPPATARRECCVPRSQMASNGSSTGSLSRNSGPLPLAPELHRSALIGFPISVHLLHASGNPVELYVRTNPTSVSAVQSVLAATADPAAPQGVSFTNPADALIARARRNRSVPKPVPGTRRRRAARGAICIANVTVIAVLERPGEIGLRRALRASPTDIPTQFVAEAPLLHSPGAPLV